MALNTFVGLSLNVLSFKITPICEQRRSAYRSRHTEAIGFPFGILVSLRGIPVEIAMRPYRPVHPGKIVVRRSRDISVSGINGKQAAICEDDSREGEVLHAAVDELLCVYKAARAQGLKPQPS